MMGRTKFAYREPPSSFTRDLVMPFEVAILDFIDANHDELARKYTQSRLQDRRDAPSVQQLEQIERDTEAFIDDVLPQKMIGSVDLDRIGYERFIAQRMNEIMLSSIAEAVLGGAPADDDNGDMSQVASRVASRKYNR